MENLLIISLLLGLNSIPQPNQATNQLSDKIVFENFEVSPMSISSENTNQPKYYAIMKTLTMILQLMQIKV